MVKSANAISVLIMVLAQYNISGMINCFGIM